MYINHNGNPIYTENGILKEEITPAKIEEHAIKPNEYAKYTIYFINDFFHDGTVRTRAGAIKTTKAGIEITPQGVKAIPKKV